MKRAKVSASDVAELAGVSRTTVSFVLNQTPGKHISEETIKKVLGAAIELNYIPNEEARKLAMVRHKSIGLFVSHSRSIFSDAFIGMLVEKLTPVLNKHRYRLVVQPLKLKQTDYLQLAEVDNVDGIILTNTHDNDEGLQKLIDTHFPTVIIGTIKNNAVSQIDIDNRQAASEVISYLAGLGHKDIAMIIHAPMAYFAAKERFAGYKEALKKAGLVFRQELVRQGDFDETSGYRAMESLLDLAAPPTAVFAGNDIMAYGAIQAIKDRGLNIPGDISIAGFDDDFFSRYLNPPLTTMTVPVTSLAQQAAKQIMEHLQLNENCKPSQKILPVTLSVRDSCKPPELT
ncbi:MAG: LacI family DNA-binding transcriptional regulator [Spirochaetales bacterium]|nr:LacI family DNA-binding transcriptional regulator [Spirochaetales bacterium]